MTAGSLRNVPPRRWVRMLGWVLGTPLFVLCLAGIEIGRVARGRIHRSVDSVPHRCIGLVLGCSPILPSGGANPFFEQRMDAAAALHRASRVEFLLLSGDHGTAGYDEPSAMKSALVERGVPADKLVLDSAGFSTLDSVVRARKVFELSEGIVVSQPDHAARAVYIGQFRGLKLDGFAARGVPVAFLIKYQVREALARIRAVVDARVLDRQPRFLGDPILIGGSECKK